MSNGLLGEFEKDIRGAVFLMRELGIRKLRTNLLDLELDPAPTPDESVSPPAPEQRPEPEVPLCHCGCPVDQHGPAGCLAGCDMNACVGSGQRPVPEEAGA